MLNLGNQVVAPPIKGPAFAKYHPAHLVRGSVDGYAWAKGVHLYSQLRPVSNLRIADSDEDARKYLDLIEEYTYAGIVAARVFGLELLELQGDVLHFHKDGSNVEDAAMAALQFGYVFTKVLYEILTNDLGDQWHGFAICMDYGESLMVRHGNTSNSSTISLGPSANRPAKRLLYGKTAAGYVEVPGTWAEKILNQTCQDEWYALNLRDRNRLPNLDKFENAELENQFRRAVNDYRLNRAILGNRSQSFVLANAGNLIEQGKFSTDNPLQMKAYCMRVDLDGFAKMVEDAFRHGDKAVENIARGFLKILEFGDYFAKSHYGVVRLSWAGDCVSFLIPPTRDLKAFRGKEWITFVEEWQTFAASSEEGRRQKWASTFNNIFWSVGMTYAVDGLCLVAPIATESRKFLIGSGAPLALAHEAQNLGKGGEVVIHSTDYDEAYPIVRTLFTKVANTDFWRAKEINMKKVRDAAIEAGKSEGASKIQIVEKAATITLPGPRAYCP